MHLDSKLIARQHWAAELSVFDAGKIDELSVLVRQVTVDHYTRHLGHAFNDQHPGHDRRAREMALEKRLIDGDVLEPDNAFVALDFQYAVNQQKGITMWKKAHDIHNAVN